MHHDQIYFHESPVIIKTSLEILNYTAHVFVARLRAAQVLKTVKVWSEDTSSQRVNDRNGMQQGEQRLRENFRTSRFQYTGSISQKRLSQMCACVCVYWQINCYIEGIQPSSRSFRVRHRTKNVHIKEPSKASAIIVSKTNRRLLSLSDVRLVILLSYS